MRPNPPENLPKFREVSGICEKLEARTFGRYLLEARTIIMNYTRYDAVFTPNLIKRLATVHRATDYADEQDVEEKLGEAKKALSADLSQN